MIGDFIACHIQLFLHHITFFLKSRIFCPVHSNEELKNPKKTWSGGVLDTEEEQLEKTSKYCISKHIELKK